VKYDVFTRDFWKPAESPGWPDNREPHPGPKTYIARGVTWAQARAICFGWNSTHEPGPMSNKAEFEEAA